MNKRVEDYSVGAIVGMVIAALINLGIFATKADIAEFKADVAMNYVNKAEMAPIVNEMRGDIRKILVRLGEKPYGQSK